jgi:hypothetical protein
MFTFSRQENLPYAGGTVYAFLVGEYGGHIAYSKDRTAIQIFELVFDLVFVTLPPEMYSI